MKTKLYIFTLIIASFILMNCDKKNPTKFEPLTNNIWTTKANLPVAMKAFTTVVNGKIYAMGGVTQHWTGDAVPTLFEYDPVADSWAEKDTLRTARIHCEVCALNGKIYVLGGTTNYENAAMSLVEEYDPVTGVWTSKSPMQAARMFFCACTANGKIYVMGGTRHVELAVGGNLSSIEEYDPTTDTWTTRASMSIPRFELTASVVGGKIYIIGGCTQQGIPAAFLPISVVEVYDPETNNLVSGTDLPSFDYAFSSKTVNGKIYVMGGFYNSTKNLMYDPDADTWIQKAEMGIGRYYHSAEVIDNKIYVIGGFDKSGVAISSVMMYTP